MKMLKIVGSIALAIISVSGQSSTNVPTNAPIINNAAINESDSASNDDWDDDKNKTGDYIDVMNEDDYPFIGDDYNDTAINDSDSTSNETWDDENSKSNTRHLLSSSHHDDYNKREMKSGDYMDQHEKEHDDESYNIYNRRNADGRNKEYSPRLVSTSYDDGSKNRNDHKGYAAMYGRNQNDVSSHSYSKSSMDSYQAGRNNDNGDYIDIMNEDDIDGYSSNSKGHYKQIYDDWQKERKTDDADDDDRYDRNNGDDRNEENSNYNTRHLLSGSYHVDHKKKTEMNNKGYGAMYGRNKNDDDKHSPNMDKSYNIYNRRNADGRNKQHSRRLSSKNRNDDKHDDRSKTYQGGRNNNNNDHNDDKKNEKKDKHNIRRLLHDSKDDIFGQNNDIFTIFQNDPRFSQSNDDEDDDIRDE